MLLRERRRPPHFLSSVWPTARLLRCPHRTSLTLPPCPRAGRVFPSTQPIDDDQCRQSTPAGCTHPGLATRATQLRRFVLPSCCFPRALLSTSIPPSASTARRRAVRGASVGAGGKSAFGARRAQLHSLPKSIARVVAAAFSRHRCVVNAGHCLRTRCFLRRPRSQIQDGGTTQ